MKTKVEAAATTSELYKSNHTTVICVKALAVHEIKPGYYGIEVPSRPIDDAHHAVLRELFPTQLEQVYSILSKEALIAAMVDYIPHD